MSIHTDEDPRECKHRPTLVEDLVKVKIDGTQKVVKIGVALPKE